MGFLLILSQESEASAENVPEAESCQRLGIPRVPEASDDRELPEFNSSLRSRVARTVNTNRPKAPSGH
ncbi:hypothetical protein J6590_086493 [Homalodisca vitripennis]|nr:hypothetical protein J6590_086493 [Homalodisca vitripennis]